jgi:hypothetical protein
MKAFSKSVPLWFLVLSPSCGGASSDGGAKYSIDVGLPAATLLRDVSPEQQVNACEKLRTEVAARFDPVQTVARACQLYGAALSDDAQSCQAIADSCVTQTANGTNRSFKTEDFDYAAQLQCADTGNGFAGCPLTVGDYEACLSDRMAAVGALLETFSCAQAASIDASTAQAAVKQLTASSNADACQTLHSECPGADPFPVDGGTSAPGLP